MDDISPNETDPYGIFLLTVINCVEQTGLSLIKSDKA